MTERGRDREIKRHKVDMNTCFHMLNVIFQVILHEFNVTTVTLVTLCYTCQYEHIQEVVLTRLLGYVISELSVCFFFCCLIALVSKVHVCKGIRAMMMMELAVNLLFLMSSFMTENMSCGNVFNGHRIDTRLNRCIC